MAAKGCGLTQHHLLADFRKWNITYTIMSEKCHMHVNTYNMCIYNIYIYYIYCNSIYVYIYIYQTKHHNGRGPQNHMFSATDITGFSKPLASKPPRVLRSYQTPQRPARHSWPLWASPEALWLIGTCRWKTGDRPVRGKEGCYSKRKAGQKKASDLVTLSIFTFILSIIIFYTCGTTCIAQLLPENAFF